MIPDTLFFALVSDGEHETLYMGYGQMCPKGSYILVAMDPSQEFLAELWLANVGPEAVIDIMPNFDVGRELFALPYQPNKQDWADMGKFKIIGRSIFDPISSLHFLEQLPDSEVQMALSCAEIEARNSGPDPKTIYERIEQVHAMRGGVAAAVEQIKQVRHLRNTGDAVRDKLKKMKGGT